MGSKQRTIRKRLHETRIAVRQGLHSADGTIAEHDLCPTRGLGRVQRRFEPQRRGVGSAATNFPHRTVATMAVLLGSRRITAAEMLTQQFYALCVRVVAKY